jgi:hypothetical protein
MSSDLLFSILPREGKVPMAHDEQKVHKVSKEAKLGALKDEEEELHHEELEVREKYHAKKQKQEQQKEQNKQPQNSKDKSPKENIEQETLSDENKKGPKHLDIYV